MKRRDQEEAFRKGRMTRKMDEISRQCCRQKKKGEKIKQTHRDRTFRNGGSTAAVEKDTHTHTHTQKGK
jgi:hypothetical protein